MKKKRKWLRICSAVAVTSLLARTAIGAVLLTDNSSVNLDSLGGIPAGWTLLATETTTFSGGSPALNGTLETDVYSRGVGGPLSFVYTVANTGAGTVTDVSRLSLNGWGLPQTIYASNVSGSPAAATADLLAGVAGFNWPVPHSILAGDTSSVVLESSLLGFTSSTATVQDGTSHNNLSIYAPVPEPTTVLAGALLLLPFGASTLRLRRKSNMT